MAKGNKWFLGHTYHSREGLYKIPFKYRKEFMGSNQDKWVEKKKLNSKTIKELILLDYVINLR